MINKSLTRPASLAALTTDYIDINAIWTGALPLHTENTDLSPALTSIYHLYQIALQATEWKPVEQDKGEFHI